MPLSLKESLCESEDLPRSDSVLMGRAELLREDERDVFEAVMIHGQPTASLARMMKVTPAALRKRVHRLAKHLVSEEFLSAARALPYLDRDDAKLARLYFCQRRSQRDLAVQLGMSMHTLRRRLDQLRAQIRTIRRIQRSGQFSRSA
jgi:DNA-directed RNA polymerase specialized sigma24 family protein